MYDKKQFHVWSQCKSGFDTVVRNDEKYELLELSRFARTGVAEAFCSTRRGGLEINLYKDLRLGEGREGFLRFCEMTGVDPKRVITSRLNMVENSIRVVTEADLVDIYDESLVLSANALVTNERNLTLFFYSADSPVVFFLAPYKRVIALVHVSCETILDGILGDTISIMERQFGISVWDLLVGIGPAIGTCCFEIDEEIARQFDLNKFSDLIVRFAGEKPHLDLYGVICEALLRRGVRQSHISLMRGICTSCDNDRFESFKASHGRNAFNGAFLTLN